MRILALTHRLPYAPNRGDRIRSHHLLRHLAADHPVDLVSLAHDHDEASRAPELQRYGIQASIAPVSRARGLGRAAIGLASGAAMTHCLLDSPALTSLLHTIVAARRPDVVLAFCSSMARFALTAPLREIPLVHDMMDVDSAKWASLAATAPPPKRWLYAREHRTLAAFERRAATAARATLVVNDRERALLAELAPWGRIEVIENGVDLDGFRSHIPPADAPVAVFCGVMNYQPNEAAAIWVARAVWPLVVAERPDAKLLLVGSSPTAAVRDLASARVTVTGAVPDTRPYLWNAAVSLAPLLTARGIQNKVLEAVAAGLPVVVTPVVAQGLPREVLPASRIAATPDAFARAVLDLFARTAGERREVAAQAALDSLTWPARLQRLAAILESARTAPARLSCD